MSGAIDTLARDIAGMTALLEEIAEKADYGNWQDVDNQMTNAVTNLHTMHKAYSFAATHFKTTRSTEILKLANGAIDFNNGPADWMATINTYLLPSGRRKGALQAWSEMVSPLVAKAALDYRSAVAQYTAYYKSLVSAQLLAANLLVEGHNYFDDNAQAASQWDSYTAMVNAQEDEFIHWLMPLVYSGVEAHAVPDATGSPGGPKYTYYEASMQLHPGLQAMPGDSGGEGYYAPTSVLASAEALLATLSVTDPKARRIVVHMVFADDQHGTFKTPIDAAPLTIEPVTNTHRTAMGSYGPVPAAHIGKFSYTPFPVPFGYTPDVNFNNACSSKGADAAGPGYMYLYRHVFSQDASGASPLPDGRYRLRNMNHDLPPFETYASTQAWVNKNTAAFQETKVLDYTLTLGPAQTFDFMNFAGYMMSFVG